MGVEAQLCPQCGAPLHYSVLEAEVVCPYCGATVVNPASKATAGAKTQDEAEAYARVDVNQIVGAMVLLQKRLNVAGVQAPAKIVSMQPMNMTVGDGKSMHGQLFSVVVEVQPEGGPAYTANAKLAVQDSSLDKYHPGTLVNVRYDPLDPTQLVFEGRR